MGLKIVGYRHLFKKMRGSIMTPFLKILKIKKLRK